MPVARNVAELWQVSRISPYAWLLLSTYNATLGAVLTFGDPVRLSGPSFVAIRDVGGGHVVGPGFLLAGVALFAAAFVGRLAVAAAYALATLGHLLFAAGQVVSVLSVDDAPLTGMPTYFWMALLHLVNARFYRRHEPPRKDDVA